MGWVMWPLTITVLAEAGQHVVVKLGTWEAHAPIAMIPICGMGHRIDLGGRINGNFKISQSSFF